MYNQLLPLVMERLARNIPALRDSFANVLRGGRYANRKLQRNARDKFACVADISTATGKEEAGPKTLLLRVSTGNCTCDGRLPSAGQAIQPENAPLIMSGRPIIYVLEEFDAGVLEASWLVSSLV